MVTTPVIVFKFKFTVKSVISTRIVEEMAGLNFNTISIIFIKSAQRYN